MDRKERPSRRIVLHIPEEVLKEDLNQLKQKALDLGASMAKIILASWIDVDEREILKCRVPLCPYFGKSSHCPPNNPHPDFMRQVFGKYARAILFALDVIPVAEFSNRPVHQKAGVEWTKRNKEITGTLESTAFGFGYYFAKGFSQFNCHALGCKPVFWFIQKDNQIGAIGMISIGIGDPA